VTLVGLDEADGHVEAGSLAGSVGTQQADDLPALDGEGDVLDHPPLIELFDQVADFEHGFPGTG
jgi:hypothetical protein